MPDPLDNIESGILGMFAAIKIFRHNGIDPRLMLERINDRVFMKRYIETRQNNEDGIGCYQFRVYHWSEDGNREIYDYKSAFEFTSKEKAIDAASEWCEGQGIEAEPEF